MINVDKQLSLFVDVSKRLKKKITAYAIGGTAMMFSGFKDSTLDIDLVFDSEKDRSVFIDAVEVLGYKVMDSVVVYGSKANHPLMLTRGDERFDLFVGFVIGFVFSDAVKSRADEIRQFGDGLFLRVVDVHDIILMKCATDRLKDKDDIIKIISLKKIDWDVVVGEAKNQVLLGRETAVFDLGCFLEDLRNSSGVDIPVSVLDSLFEFVKQQADAKRVRK
jgi:hypothetical protein